MDLKPTSPRLAADWLPWVARWCWLLLAALTLAWQGSASMPALLATAAYAVVQLALSLRRLRPQANPLQPRVAAAIDTAGPLAVIVAAGGEPDLLFALLLAVASSVGTWLGPVWAALWLAAALAAAGLGLGWLWGSLSAGLLRAALFLPPILLAGLALAWAVRRTAKRQANAKLPAIRDSLLPRRQRQVVRSVPLDEKLREEDLLRLTVELGLESLAASGLPRDDLDGLALARQADGLRVVGGDRPDLDRWLGESLPQRGLLASALERATVVEGELGTRDGLGRVAKQLGWRRAICLPLEADRGCFGVVLIGRSQPQRFDEDHLSVLHSLGQEARVALRYAELYEELSRERDRINEIQEEARKKLARDLHDGPTQVIAAIAMRTNFARRQLQRDAEAAAKELETVEQMARATTMEIRHMLFTLRPLILESQGLGTALRQYAEKVGETHGQAVIVEVEPAVEALIGREREAPLFYIAEEAVNNAQKHAASAHIWVRLRREEGGILLEIEDDGVGFNVGAVDAHYEQRGSLGMVSMRERAQLLGGTLEIASEEGTGTSIRAHIPPNTSLEQAQPRRDTPASARS